MTRLVPSSVLRVLTAVLCALGLAACANPPALDGAIDPALQDAAYPKLAPVDTLLPPQPLDPDANQTRAQNLERRSTGLQARATRLQQQDPIDAETRRRLNSDIVTD